MSALSESGSVVAGIPWYAITAMAWGPRDTLWITSAQHGGIVSIAEGEIRHYSRANSPIPDNAVTAVFVDQGGARWFGTARASVFTDDDRGLRVVRGPSGGRLLVELITQDRAGRVWVATQSHVLACYRGDAIDEELTAEVKARRARCVHRAPDGDLWMVGDSPAPDVIRLLRFDGEAFHELDAASTQPFAEPRALYFHGQMGALYIASFGATLRYTGGATSPVSPADFGLDAEALEIAAVDQSQHLWLRWQPRVGSREHKLGRWDGARVVELTGRTPLELGFRGEILEDPRGRLWFASARTGLMMLDDGGWTIFPVAPKAAASSFQTHDDLELFLLPAVHPDVEELFNDPRAYHGKKICLKGELRAGLDEGSLILEGERQSRGIWPDRQRAASLAKRGGVEVGLERRATTGEFVGFLEYEGGYGYMGGYPYRFTITEAYPRPCSDAERASIQMRYRIALKSENAEAQSIKDLLDQWGPAFERADIEALKHLAYPASPWARELNDPRSTARWAEAAPLRLTYERPWIRIESPTSASVRLLNVHVEPRAPAYKGALALHSLGVGKVEKAWKVRAVGLDIRPEGTARERRWVSESDALNERLGRVYDHPLRGTSAKARSPARG